MPGDKSISHRALMLGGLALGETVIEGLLEGDDVLATARAMRALGADIRRDGGGGDAGPGIWRVRGRGVGGLRTPGAALDFGNSGTGARLMMGLVASHPISAEFTGDASLSGRPMNRVLEPLSMMGAVAEAERPGLLPLTLSGAASPLPIDYEVPVPSAQVKSAVLMAALNTPGTSIVREKTPTRDHTERMLAHFGASPRIQPLPDGGVAIAIDGYGELHGRPLSIPADPSSAAFVMVAGLIVPGSEVCLRDVMINPLRAGLMHTLVAMGGDIELGNERLLGAEPVADITVRASRLKGVIVPAGRAASMIDEYPALAVAAACADGETAMAGLAELKVKESDRLAAIAAGLGACGCGNEIVGDTLIVAGGGAANGVPGGADVETRHDHRIAMAFLMLGLVADAPVKVNHAAMIDTSFPGFAALMTGLGAAIATETAP